MQQYSLKNFHFKEMYLQHSAAISIEHTFFISHGSVETLLGEVENVYIAVLQIYSGCYMSRFI